MRHRQRRPPRRHHPRHPHRRRPSSVSVRPPSSTAGVNYNDRFVKPNYTADLSELNGKLGAFSSAPLAAGEAPRLAEVSLTGRGRGHGFARDHRQAQSAGAAAGARHRGQGARPRAAAALAVCHQVRRLRHRARQDERRCRLPRAAQRQPHGEQQDRAQPARLRRQGRGARRPACRSSWPSRCWPTAAA